MLSIKASLPEIDEIATIHVQCANIYITLDYTDEGNQQGVFGVVLLR